MGFPAINPAIQFFDDSGNPLSGGLLFSYVQSTSTKKTTYTNADLNAQNTNPIVLDDAGRCSLFLTDGETYKFVLAPADDTDPPANPIWTRDKVKSPTALTQAGVGALLYPQTAAEIAAGVTPTDYVRIPDLPSIDARRYGFSTSATASQNVTALTAALAVASADGGIVQMPSGSFDVNSKITIPSNVQLIGSGIGYGVYGSTILNYTGSDIAIQVDGYYSRLADFFIKQSGTGTVGVYVTATQFMMERVSIIPASSTGFSISGYQSKTDGVVFTHILKRCYIYGCTIGVDFSQGNNFIIDGCFIESNGTNVRAAYVGTVTNLVICNGTVIELFGDGRAAETNNSIGIDLYDTTGGVLGFTCRDSYFEVNGTSHVAAAGQLAINLRKCSGGIIQGNYMFGGGQATNLIHAQANAKSILINANHFNDVNGYAVVEDSGSQVEFGINAAPSPTTGVVNRTIAITPTSLTVVNGTGGATYAISFTRRDNWIKFRITISVTGNATTASVAGSTYFTLPNPMVAPVANGTCFAAAANNSNYGTGLIATNSRIYPPSWSAINEQVYIEGEYQVAQV